MQQSPLRLVEKCAEFKDQNEIGMVPRGLRGIYVLYRKRRDKVYDVVYVGMAASGKRKGIRARLSSHKRKKGNLWTHFSIFKVWDNIRDEEIRELEGLFRHLYRRDSRANKLNKQKGFYTIRNIRLNNLEDWS